MRLSAKWRGQEYPDEGALWPGSSNQWTITYGGRQVVFRNPGTAIAAGIGMVHQEILLVNEYTVWQNAGTGRRADRPLGPG